MDYRVLTPGAAVAETLQALLAQKRAEERQAYLDRLNEEELRSQQIAREQRMQLDREAEERMRALADVQAQMGLEQVLQDRLKLLAPGTPLEQIGDEFLREQLLRRSLIEERPVGGPPSEPDQPPDVVRVFPGTPEQQAAAQRSALIESLVQTLPEDTRAAAQAAAVGAPGALLDLFKPRTPGKIYDPATRRFLDVPGAQAPVSDPLLAVLPYPPVSTRLSIPQTYQLYKDGQFQGTFIGTPEELRANREALAAAGVEVRPESYRPPAEAAPAATLRREVARTAADLAVARAGRGRVGSFLRWLTGGADPTAPYEDAYRAALGQLFAQDPAPAALKDLAVHIAADPVLSQKSVHELAREPLVDAATGQVYRLSPQDLEVLNRLLLSARGVSSQGAIPVVE